MKAEKQLPSAETLRKIFDYNPETGKLFWKVRPREHFKEHYAWIRFNSEWPMTEAGIATRRGYIYVKFGIAGEKWMVGAHRIIFQMLGLLRDGMEPDHKNGVMSDNRRCNLRLATRSQNCSNRGKMKTGKDQSLPKGVSKANGGKYHAQCMANGISHRLGRFSTPEEAHAAYCAKAKELHGEFHSSG